MIEKDQWFLNLSGCHDHPEGTRDGWLVSVPRGSFSFILWIFESSQFWSCWSTHKQCGLRCVKGHPLVQRRSLDSCQTHVCLEESEHWQPPESSELKLRMLDFTESWASFVVHTNADLIFLWLTALGFLWFPTYPGPELAEKILGQRSSATKPRIPCVENAVTLGHGAGKHLWSAMHLTPVQHHGRIPPFFAAACKASGKMVEAKFRELLVLRQPGWHSNCLQKQSRKTNCPFWAATLNWNKTDYTIGMTIL